MTAQSTPSTLRSDPPHTTSPRPVLEVIRGFPLPVKMLFVGMFLNRFGTFVIPFLALHLTRMGHSIAHSGLAVGCYGMGHLLASLIGGHLADTWGRRNTIILSMTSSAVSMVLLSQAYSYSGVLILAFLAGLAAELYRPASSALISDFVRTEDRLVAFAAFRFAINLGWAFGPATAGFLTKFSYTWLFFLDALSSLLFAGIAFRGLPHESPDSPDLAEQNPQSPPGKHRPQPNLFQSLRLCIQDRAFVQVTLCSFGIALVFMQIFSTFGMELKNHGLTETQYGILLGSNGAWIVFLEILITRWTRAANPRLVMALGYLLIGTSMFAILLTNTFAGYFTAMTFFTFGEMISMPVAMAYVSTLAPPDRRGRYMGIYGLSWAFAIALGPSLGMLLYQENREALWALAGSLAFLSAFGIKQSSAAKKLPM